MLLNGGAQAHAEFAPNIVWDLTPDSFAIYFHHHALIRFVVGWDRFASFAAMPIQDWSFRSKVLR
jgi:hypothetical protein